MDKCGGGGGGSAYVSVGVWVGGCGLLVECT